MRWFASLFAIGALALAPAAALAGPAAYVNAPFSTPNELVNGVIATLNGPTGLPSLQILSTCSGTTTATCQGLKVQVSVTGLTTAAGVTSATMTVTDALAAVASNIVCAASNYGGAGNPMPVDVVAAAGTFTFAVQNTHATAALNATVPVVCFVYN